MSKEIDNILDECIDRVLHGEDLEQCLARYSRQAEELRPLIEVALAASRSASIEPRPEFKARARYELRSTLAAAATKKSQETRPTTFGWWQRWAAVAAAVFILLMGGGTVAAAGNSLPGSPLYQVKLTRERAEIALARSPLSKAKLHARFADRRMEEISRVASRGDAQDIDMLTERFDQHLEKIEFLMKPEYGPPKMEGMMKAPPPAPAAAPRLEAVPETTFPPVRKNTAELKQILLKDAERHQKLLQEIERSSPDAAKPALRRAMNNSARCYKQALQAIDD